MNSIKVSKYKGIAQIITNFLDDKVKEEEESLYRVSKDWNS